jgi:hypothetical protein
MGIGVHVLGHPVVRIRRDKAGKLLAWARASANR